MKKIIIGLGVVLFSTQLALVKANEDISGITLPSFYHNVDLEKDGIYDYKNTFKPGSTIQGGFSYNDSIFFLEKYGKISTGYNSLPNLSNLSEEEKNKYDIIISYKSPRDTCFNKDNVFSINTRFYGNNIDRDYGIFKFYQYPEVFTFRGNNFNNETNVFQYSIDNGNTWINYENKENFQNDIETSECITDMRIKNPITTEGIDNGSVFDRNYFIYRYAYDIPADYKGDTLTETINLKLINNQTGTVTEKVFENTLKKYEGPVKICKPGKLKFIVKEKEGTLRVEYYDKETGEEISEHKTEKGKVDEDYTTKAIDIAGYTYDSVEGEETGKFTEGEKVIKYFYTKLKETPLPKEGTLRVEYYDKETLEKISEDKTEKGEVDKDYSTKAIEIADYTYDSVEGEENGKFTEGETVVKYFYTKVKTAPVVKEGRLTVLYLDKETREKISEDKTEKGEVDKDYSTKAIEIANYTYDSVEGEETGKFIEGEKIVRYFYTKVKTVATPKEENIILGSAPSIPNIEKDSRVITTENTVKETPKITNEKEKEIIKEALKIEEPIKEEKISFEPVSPIEITNEEIYLPKVLPKTGAEHWLILLFISFIMSHFILNVKGRNS